jgi:hypothetical protein
MMSRRSDRIFGRAVAVAAAIAAFALPWVPPAHAAPPAAPAEAEPRRSAAPAEAEPRRSAAPAKTKSKAKKGRKPAPEGAKHVKKDAPKQAKEKKTAAREGAAKRRGGKKRAAAPAKPCLGPAIQIDRSGLELERITLVDCAGKPREEGRRALSVLARPWGAARPSQLPDPGVRLLDAGLLARIDALARKYPGRTVSLVSGYRPQSNGSLHQSARAVDMRIAGVRNEELAAACRALADTGCGYYPNSSFVHIDVRAPGTGTVSWIDASGPGEPPRYVTSWPPRDDDGTPPGKPGAAPEVAGAGEPHGAPVDGTPLEHLPPPTSAPDPPARDADLDQL